jgi:hypothetical protein
VGKVTRGQGTRVKLARGQGDKWARGQGGTSSGDKLASGHVGKGGSICLFCTECY